MNKTVIWLGAISIVFAIVIIASLHTAPFFASKENNEALATKTKDSAVGISPKTDQVTPISVESESSKVIALDSAGTIDTVDVVIFGSELEGMYLARAAADEGLKVKILDPRELRGGQLLQGQMLFLDETWDDQHKTLLQGKPKTLFDGFKNGKIRKLSEFTAYYDKLIKDIPLESGIQIDKINTAPELNGLKAITSITYRTKDQQLKRIKADYWVENTDFGFMTNKLQTTRLPGLEKFYGADHIEYMSAGWSLNFKNVDWHKFSTYYNSLTSAEKSKLFGGGYVNDSFIIGLTGMARTYKTTDDRLMLRGLNAVNQKDGDVMINALLIYGVDPSNNQSLSEAEQLGRKEAPLILNHFRKHLVGWEHADLNGFPTHPYIREYNHYETDHVMSVSDMLSGRMFYDNVSIGGYPLDLQGTTTNKWGIEMGRPDKYGIPLRSFLLKNYENVILAGKNIGSSAIAYGSARIQPNTSIAAESIGVILGEIHGKKKLRDLKEHDWPTLHTTLQNKHQIKLTGVKGANRLVGWTEDEIKKLDEGQIIYPSYVKQRKAPH